MGALILIIVIIGIVIYVKKNGSNDNSGNVTTTTTSTNAQHWTPPTTFDEHVVFFTKIADSLGRYEPNKSTELFVGADIKDNQAQCFISLNGYDIHESALYNVGIQYGIPSSAINYALKYSKHDEDDTQLFYEVVTNIQPQMRPGYYSKLVQQNCSSCYSDDWKLRPESIGTIKRFGRKD